MLYKVNEKLKHSVCFAVSLTGEHGSWTVMHFQPKEVVAIVAKHPDIFEEKMLSSMRAFHSELDGLSENEIYNTFEIVSSRFSGFMRIDQGSFNAYFIAIEGTGKVQCCLE